MEEMEKIKGIYTYIYVAYAELLHYLLGVCKCVELIMCNAYEWHEVEGESSFIVYCFVFCSFQFYIFCSVAVTMTMTAC